MKKADLVFTSVLSVAVFANVLWVGYRAFRYYGHNHEAGKHSNVTASFEGVHLEGDRRIFHFDFFNSGRRKIRILGCGNSCGFTVLTKIPVSIEPNQHLVVRFKELTKAQNGTSGPALQVNCWTNDSDSPVAVRAAADVKPAQSRGYSMPGSVSPIIHPLPSGG